MSFPPQGESSNAELDGGAFVVVVVVVDVVVVGLVGRVGLGAAVVDFGTSHLAYLGQSQCFCTLLQCRPGAQRCMCHEVPSQCKYALQSPGTELYCSPIHESPSSGPSSACIPMVVGLVVGRAVVVVVVVGRLVVVVGLGGGREATGARVDVAVLASLLAVAVHLAKLGQSQRLTEVAQCRPGAQRCLRHIPPSHCKYPSQSPGAAW